MSASLRCLVLLALAAPSSALAAAPDGLDDAQLSRRAGVLAQYAALVDPNLADLAPAEHEHGPQCMTGLVMDLRDNPELFSDDEWFEMTNGLGLPAHVVDASLPVPPPAADGTCVGETSTNSVSSEHFVVYWNSATETQATNLLDALEESWVVLVDDLAWRAPEGSDQYKIRFQIDDSNYAGAYTTIDYCTGVGYMPYMVTGRGSFSGNWYKTMAAHELNHAIQFGYGYAHEFYWWEATATWVEEYAYPSYNDWADMYVYFSYYPYVSLNASSQSIQEVFGHMYAMGIFGTYLDENHGGHDTVMGTWDESVSQPGTYNYWMPDVIEDMDMDFDEVWQGFMAHTAFMDFTESNYYYDIQDVDDVGSLPADGDEPRNAAWSLGINYFEIDEDEGAEGKYLQVDFDGDDSIEWNVVLVSGSGNSVEQYVGADIDDGEGSAWLPFDGDDKAYLVVSPKDEDVGGYNYNWNNVDEYEYEWELCLVDSETGVLCGEDVDESDGGGSEDDPATPDDAESKGGCGCAAPAGPMGAVWAISMLGLAMRRRRS